MKFQSSPMIPLGEATLWNTFSNTVIAHIDVKAILDDDMPTTLGPFNLILLHPEDLQPVQRHVRNKILLAQYTPFGATY